MLLCDIVTFVNVGSWPSRQTIVLDLWLRGIHCLGLSHQWTTPLGPSGATAVGKGIVQPSNQFWEDEQAWERLPLASCPSWVGPVTILGQNDAISLHNQIVLNAGKF